MSNYKQLQPEEVTFRINADELDLEGSLNNDWGIIGQERAVQAFTMGVAIRARGYNIFVSGDSGTGRSTAIKKILSQNNQKPADLCDIAYVHNFTSHQTPHAIYLEPGQGIVLKKDLHLFIEELKSVIRLRLESDLYKSKRDRIISKEEKEENRRFGDFEEVLTKEGFRIIQVSDGDSQAADIAPVYDNEVTDFDGLQELVKKGEMTQEDWDTIREKYYHFIDEMKVIFQKLRIEQDKMDEELDTLRIETVSGSIKDELVKLRSNFKTESVSRYFDLLEKDILANLDLFTEDEEELEEYEDFPLAVRYGVNVIVDNTESDAAPVIFENHPGYANLFGSIETRFEKAGENTSNFMLIRAGSLLRANKGFLVIRVDDLLQEEDVWVSLMRTLQTNTVEIQPKPGLFQLNALTLKPEPIIIDVKIILIGNEFAYNVLYQQDKNFQKFFKITADFDSVMDLNKHSTAEYITFINSVIKTENLRELTPGGYATIIEQGVRLAERKDLITTRFSRIADILVEAEYYAGLLKKDKIDREVLLYSIEQKSFLFGLAEKKIDDEVISKRILLDIEGNAVGVVNGLAVYDRGYYSFGRPLRLTAQTSPGEEGIINVEREAGLSGEIYDKGVLIIEGFFRRRFSIDMPLTLNASICFEQSYSGIDGDSASSAEIYALLSSLSEIPLRQDIAVTGSVNQLGEIQPIGGVIEKVEGFYTTCKKLGLTGQQGVIIPQSNLNNLIVNDEVAEAVKDNLFHIYPISTIDQGIEILTGFPSGKRGEDGCYPEKTVNYAVFTRLREYNIIMKRWK